PSRKRPAHFSAKLLTDVIIRCQAWNFLCGEEYPFIRIPPCSCLASLALPFYATWIRVVCDALIVFFISNAACAIGRQSMINLFIQKNTCSLEQCCFISFLLNSHLLGGPLIKPA